MSVASRRLLLLFAVCVSLLSALAGTPADGARRASQVRRGAKAHRHAARRHARAHKRHHKKKAPAPSPSPQPEPTSGESPQGVPGPTEVGPASSDPFAALPLYVEPGSPAAQTAAEWSREGRSAEAAQIEKIATRPVAKWFGDWSYGHGGTEGDVSWWVGQAAAAGDMPLLVAYDLPWRDCGQYSAGGAASAAAYKSFIEQMAAGIAGRRAAVILEPDALAELECLSAERQTSYYSLLGYAVKTLGAGGGTAVYLDAGHAGWQPPATMATRLTQAGVAGARGFALNVSSFGTTAAEQSYGEAIVSALGGASHFVIDTSRNGRGPAGSEWCNPPGRGLGTAPTASTPSAEIDALLWVKHPGTSDGACNGGPAAGTWWSAAALELATNSAG